MKKSVVEIKKNKKNIKVIFNDDTFFEMNEDVFTDYYIYIGKEFEFEEIKEIEDKVNYIKHYDYIVKLLLKRPYSRKKIIDKLKVRKNINYYQIEKIVKRLEENNLIDDERFSKELIDELESKKYGFNRIVHELEKEDLKQYIKLISFDFDKEIEKAKYHLNNLVKKYDNYSFNKMKDSLYESYYRLGFKDEVIKIVIEQLNKDLIYDNEKEKIYNDYLKITIKMDNEEKNNQKQRIIERLLRKGYRFYDIIDVIERFEDGKIY